MQSILQKFIKFLLWPSGHSELACVAPSAEVTHDILFPIEILDSSTALSMSTHILLSIRRVDIARQQRERKAHLSFWVGRGALLEESSCPHLLLWGRGSGNGVPHFRGGSEGMGPHYLPDLLFVVRCLQSRCKLYALYGYCIILVMTGNTFPR